MTQNSPRAIDKIPHSSFISWLMIEAPMKELNRSQNNWILLKRWNFMIMQPWRETPHILFNALNGFMVPFDVDDSKEDIW